MSQYQPNAAPGRSLISKINSKFSNMSISHHVEKDGSSEDDTLIHNAFVKFFDSRGQAYPEWLGVAKSKTSNSAPQLRYAQPDYLLLKYQPVRADYNSTPEPNSYAPKDTRPSSTGQALQASSSPSEERPGYTRRSNSRLQDMYQRLRASAGSQVSPSTPGRSSSGSAPTARTTAAGQRLREKMMGGPSSSAPTWGRN